MNKTEIKKIIKEYGYIMITKSYFIGEHGVLFNAYNDCGDCFNFWISHERTYATKQMYSIVTVHDSQDITNWFK